MNTLHHFGCLEGYVQLQGANPDAIILAQQKIVARASLVIAEIGRDRQIQDRTAVLPEENSLHLSPWKHLFYGKVNTMKGVFNHMTNLREKGETRLRPQPGLVLDTGPDTSY